MNQLGSVKLHANSDIQNGFGKFQVTFQIIMKKIKELYNRYKSYVRIDLIMYAVMILFIILYFIISIIFN
jgi:hypothetical protein